MMPTLYRCDLQWLTLSGLEGERADDLISITKAYSKWLRSSRGRMRTVIPVNSRFTILKIRVFSKLILFM